MDGNKSNSFDDVKMDSSSENIDHRVLRDGENSVNAEWSATTSALNLSDTSTSNSNICVQTLKECCANPSETLKDKEDFMVVDSTFTTATNLTHFNADETNFSSIQKTMAFQTKHKSNSHNYSRAFENILDDDSQLEETQNSLYLNRFQKRKKLLTHNNEDFADNFDINKSNDSEMDSEEERMRSSKLRFSKKNKNQSCSEILDFNLSTTKNSTIADDANVSKVNSVFKKPSDLSLVNYSSTIDTNMSNELNLKFTRQIVDDVGSAFDGVVNDSSVTSNTAVNNKETSSSNLSVSYVYRPLVDSAIDELNLNQTYDVPPNCNSTRIGSLSQSLKNNREVMNSSIEQPINVTYNVENDLTSSKSTNNVSLDSVNTKCTLSDTYTVKYNLHETFTQRKSASNTVNTLTDICNTISQSKLPIRVCNSIHKQQLDKVLQDNIKVQDADNNTTANSEMHGTDNNKSNRFKLKKFNGADSNIMLSQGNEALSENTNVSNNAFSNTLNISTDTLDYDLSNISSKSNKNMEDLTNTSSTQPSNLILHAANENDLNISVIPTLPNTSNNSLHYKPKFNFGKQFGRQSLSYHEKSKNLTENLQNTSLNSSLLKIPIDGTNCFNKVSNKFDDNSDLRSLSLKIQEHYPNSQEVLQPLSDSLLRVSNTLSNEVEKDNHTLNTTFNPSQPSDLHFTGKHNPHVNSMVFNDLVENSLNDNTSLNVTKQVTFKTSKNLPDEYHSAIFDDLITNSQESNSTLTQNKLSNNSKLNDLGDELSIYANTDELSISNSNCFEKLDNNCSQTLNLKKQICSKDELNCSENTSKLTNIATLNNKSYVLEKTGLKILSDPNNSEPICLSHETSSELHNTFSPDTSIHSSNTSTNSSDSPKHSSNISYYNDELPLTNNSTGSSKKKRKSNEIDGPEILNITQNSLKKNKLTNITQVTRSRSVSVNKDNTLTGHNSMILTKNMNDESMFLTTSSYISQNSQKENNLTSTRVTRSRSVSVNKDNMLTEHNSMISTKNMNNESMFLTTSSYISQNSQKENNLTSTRVTRSRSVSVNKDKTLTEQKSTSTNNINHLSIHSLGILETRANSINENNLTSTRITRSRSMSVNKSKTLSDHKSIVSENNENQVSDHSLGTLETGANSVNENMNNKTEDESILWTTLSSSITESSQKKNSSTDTRVTRSSSVSVDKSKTSDHKSIVSKNNENQVSDHSLGTLETGANSVNENMNNKTEDESILWTTLSSNITESSQKKNSSTDTRVTRSSSVSVDKSKTSDHKSIVSENNENQVSDHSLGTLETGANSVNENMNKTEDESIFWTTLSSSITESSQKKNSLTDTRVTRSRSVSVNKSKALSDHKSIVSVNNVNQVSAHSLGTLETRANSLRENINDKTDDDKSIYWTTLPSESVTNTSATNNVIENENQTPRNKPTLVEHIFNTIGKMSVHKRKSVHPGAFELDDYTRQHLVSTRSLHNSPSFITKMLARNNNSESILSPQSNSESFIELPQVEETVKRKFKSLYNKESWITKRLYNFLVSKLKPKYNIRSVKYAEKFVKYLASILRQIYQKREDLQLYSDMLRFHMARYQMINDTADYLQFLTDFIPRPYYDLLFPGWNLETSSVKFEPTKYYLPIMSDEELLQKVTAYLNEA